MDGGEPSRGGEPLQCGRMPVVGAAAHRPFSSHTIHLVPCADMYESTMDILYNLWEAVSVGGYIIIDDWT